MLKYLVGLIIIALVGVGVFFVVGRDDDQKNNDLDQPSETTSQNVTNETTNNSQTATETSRVSISNFAFTPTDITVKKDTTVTWTNNDSVAHTIEFETDDIPKSETLGNGQTFSFIFNDAGTFNYSCGIHPSMHGTVTVTEELP